MHKERSGEHGITLFGMPTPVHRLQSGPPTPPPFSLVAGPVTLDHTITERNVFAFFPFYCYLA